MGRNSKTSGWSPMDLPVKWRFSEYKFDVKYVFQENALGILLIQLSEIFCLRFYRFNATAGRIPMKTFRVFKPFLTQMGPKVDFAPGAMRILFFCYQRWGG